MAISLNHGDNSTSLNLTPPPWIKFEILYIYILLSIYYMGLVN